MFDHARHDVWMAKRSGDPDAGVVTHLSETLKTWFLVIDCQIMYSERASPCKMKPGHPAEPSRQLHAGWAPGCRVDVQVPHAQKLKHRAVRADCNLIIVFWSKPS